MVNVVVIDVFCIVVVVWNWLIFLLFLIVLIWFIIFDVLMKWVLGILCFSVLIKIQGRVVVLIMFMVFFVNGVSVFSVRLVL